MSLKIVHVNSLPKYYQNRIDQLIQAELSDYVSKGRVLKIIIGSQIPMCKKMRADHDVSRSLSETYRAVRSLFT